MPDSVASATEALYRADPKGFVAARDEWVRELRSTGDREGAKEVAALRRPTVGAWLVNLLVADEPALADRLAELASQLRTAQAHLAGDALRSLGRQRQELVSGLVVRARSLARQQGVRAPESALVEVEESLRAALADPAVAREVLSGRLVRAADHAGFGPSPVTAVPAAAPAVRGAAPDRTASPLTAKERRAAEREKREAEKALRAAQQAKDAADEELARAEEDAGTADQARAAATARVGSLQSQLDRAQAELGGATKAAERAAERARTAAAAARQAAYEVARRAER